MKAFFLIMFFGKINLITPIPLTVEDVVTLIPDRPLAVVTTGAHLEIDVSAIITIGQKEGVEKFKKRVEKLFPHHVIEATLVQGNGKGLQLYYTGGHIFNNEGTWLSLYSKSGIPTDLEFVKVVVKTKVKMEGVMIRWRNYKY